MITKRIKGHLYRYEETWDPKAKKPAWKYLGPVDATKGKRAVVTGEEALWTPEATRLLREIRDDLQARSRRPMVTGKAAIAKKELRKAPSAKVWEAIMAPVVAEERRKHPERFLD